MKKWFAQVFLLTIPVLFAVLALQTPARDSKTAGKSPVPGPGLILSNDVQIAELNLVISELRNRGQTNALSHLNLYLSTMVMNQHVADAEMTLAVLERLRAYRTDEAMELLEFQLDSAVAGILDGPAGSKTNRIAETRIIDRVKAYRARFPRRR